MSREVPFLDLARQQRAHQEPIERAVLETLRRGWYVLGEEGAAFEREFAAYCGVGHAVGVGSGTDALHLALRACGVGPGDAVITAPNTAVPTVCAIVAAGARPVFVDIDPRTFTLDPDRLAAYLRAQPAATRVRAVVPVHLYGHPAAPGPIREIAAEHGLAVIEDAAQAHGAAYAGQKAGSLGTAGCFSFYPTKNLGACGDAGMVVTDDADLADAVRRLRNYGEESRDLNRTWGVNSRLDELQAAILRVKLRELDGWVEARRARARQYDELLAETSLTLPVEIAPARHAYHLYVVRSRDRDGLRSHLRASGIEARVHYPRPVHHQPAYQDLGYAPGDFPEAERACREVLSLPLSPELTDEELHRVARAIREFHP